MEGMTCPDALIKAINKDDLQGVHAFSSRANVHLFKAGTTDTPLVVAWWATVTWSCDIDIVRVLFGKGGKLPSSIMAGAAFTARLNRAPAGSGNDKVYEDMDTEQRQGIYKRGINGLGTVPSYQKTDGLRNLENFLFDLKRWDTGDIVELRDKVLAEVVERRKLEGSTTVKFEPARGKPLPKGWADFADKINEAMSDTLSESSSEEFVLKTDRTNIKEIEQKHGEGESVPSNPSRTLNQQVDEIVENSGLVNIIGLTKVKDTIKQLARDVLIEQLRRQRNVGQALPREPLHMVFLGNPGTGKTSVARLLARILQDAGVTKRDVLVEVQREDLVGQHIGQSEHRTAEVVNAAKGGVMFIDEAYRLYSVSQKDYGMKALETIMKEMLSGDPVMIFAGYPSNMQQFLDMNPGLRRRISFYFNFDDYTTCDIAQMFHNRVKRLSYKLEEDVTTECLSKLITDAVSETMLGKVNAGLVDLLFARARFELNGRLTGLEEDDEMLVTFRKSDIENALTAIATNFESCSQDQVQSPTSKTQAEQEEE